MCALMLRLSRCPHSSGPCGFPAPLNQAGQLNDALAASVVYLRPGSGERSTAAKFTRSSITPAEFTSSSPVVCTFLHSRGGACWRGDQRGTRPVEPAASRALPDSCWLPSHRWPCSVTARPRWPRGGYESAGHLAVSCAASPGGRRSGIGPDTRQRWADFTRDNPAGRPSLWPPVPCATRHAHTR